MTLIRFLIATAWLATMASRGGAQSPDRSPVMLTIAEGTWGTDGPPIVILPDAHGSATVLLRSSATPEDLFAGVAIFEKRRLENVTSGGKVNLSRIIVTSSQPAAQLREPVRKRLDGYLRKLSSAGTRQIGEYGALKAMEVRFLLRNSPSR